jgi:hypothetical protein
MFYIWFMSKIFDVSQEMSFAEKGTWLSTGISLVAYILYWWIVLARARGAPIIEVTYGDVMLGCAMAVIVTSIVAHIVVAVLSPKDADKKDQRDTDINRYGDAVSYYVLTLSVVAVLILTVTGTTPFWIANALYASCTVATLSGSIVKLVVYRRGF